LEFLRKETNRSAERQARPGRERESKNTRHPGGLAEFHQTKPKKKKKSWVKGPPGAHGKTAPKRGIRGKEHRRTRLAGTFNEMALKEKSRAIVHWGDFNSYPEKSERGRKGKESGHSLTQKRQGKNFLREANMARRKKKCGR